MQVPDHVVDLLGRNGIFIQITQSKLRLHSVLTGEGALPRGQIVFLRSYVKSIRTFAQRIGYTARCLQPRKFRELAPQHSKFSV